LDAGEAYDPAWEGEEILLQGVVDCAILESDGIILVDFKTDRVSEETLDLKVQRYKSQVDAYAGALARIYEKPVKEKYLYFFHMNRAVKV
jgi:ATP-dependent helicase/nuclease subunit A